MDTHILQMRVDAESYASVANRVQTWADDRSSRSLCFATVHMVMESHANSSYRDVVNSADLVLPDGMPLVWCLKALGAKNASRVYGPDTTEQLLQVSADIGIPVAFYGSSPATLGTLLARVRGTHPNLNIAYAYSPPFRPLTAAEDNAIVREINSSGARIIFVGLGCPKQEQWMAEHRGRVNAVMLGVGAAFDFLAGTKPQAPRWMMNHGLEWVFRFATEPRRLWLRYLKHNPRFVVLFFLQLLRPSAVNNL